MNEGFELVPLRRGGVGIRSLRYDEICHPGVGPREEAEEVYLRALDLRRRWAMEPGDFVIWDVGLGGAANATAVITAAANVAVGCSLHMISFDWNVEPLRFALGHAAALEYFGGLETQARELVERAETVFEVGRARIRWEFVQGDFTGRMKHAVAWERGHSCPPGEGTRPLGGQECPRSYFEGSRLRGFMERQVPAPHAILYDPHSPSANPEMWTLPLFSHMHARLDPECLCGLATYSRSTAVRVSLLLAGFWVGAGRGTATKEETTVAANRREGVSVPLDGRWLERARRSRAAEPWVDPPFGGRPLSEETWEQLKAHPQFAAVAGSGPEAANPG